MNEIDLTKLPKRVQEHIKNLQRDRDIAVRELNKYLDSQTEDKFRINDLLCIGEQTGPSYKTRHIQGDKIECVHAGIQLTVMANNDNYIYLQWSGEERLGMQVAMIPTAFQSVELIHKNKMRV